MKRLVTVLAMFLLVPTACSSISEGTVIDKWTEPPRDYVMWLPIQTGSICSSGKYTTCTPIYTYFPYQMHDDEDYVIKLRNCVDDEGDCREGERYISDQAEWERIAINSWWSDKKVESGWSAEDKDAKQRRVSRQEAEKLPKQPPRSGS